MIVDRKDHVQYISYSDDSKCSLTEQNIALNDLFYGSNVLFKNMKHI